MECSSVSSIKARLLLLLPLKPVPVLLGKGGGASLSSSRASVDGGGPPLSAIAIDRLGGGTAGGVAAFALIENLQSEVPSAEIAGDTGVLSRLGFFGLIGGAGLRCAAADAAEEIDLRDGDGEMSVRTDGGVSSALLVSRRGGS